MSAAFSCAHEFYGLLAGNVFRRHFQHAQGLPFPVNGCPLFFVAENILLHLWILNNSNKNIFGNRLHCNAVFGTVSYTHLDVYKRQHMALSV